MCRVATRGVSSPGGATGRMRMSVTSDLQGLCVSLTDGALLTSPESTERYRRDRADILSPRVPLTVMRAGNPEDLTSPFRRAHTPRGPGLPPRACSRPARGGNGND